MAYIPGTPALILSSHSRVTEIPASNYTNM